MGLKFCRVDELPFGEDDGLTCHDGVIKINVLIVIRAPSVCVTFSGCCRLLWKELEVPGCFRGFAMGVCTVQACTAA